MNGDVKGHEVEPDPDGIVQASEAVTATQIRDGNAVTLFGAKVGRDALIYASTGVIAVFFGLISVAVLTRLLPPAQYGHLAVYSFFMIILMVIYNLGSLQGTMSFVFGGGGDEDDDGDDDDLLDPALITAGDRRRALGTGLAWTALIGLVATIPIWIFASDLAPIVSKGSHDAGPIRWAAVGGMFAAVWRLAGNVTRVERRPYAYAVLHVLHPMFTLAVSIPLLATGYGVEGAVAGVALGNVVALVAALIVIRRSWRPAFRPREVYEIYKRGGPRILVTMSTWLIHNGDIFLASRYLVPTQVGIYRVGSRVGSTTSHWTSAFNMSYGPMRRDPLFLAARRESGTVTQATAAAYFVIVTTTIVLAMAVFAELLVRIAGPQYASAAPLIPLAAISFASHGTYVLTYRLSTFPRRRRWFISLGVTALVIFVSLGIPLTRTLGVYGPITAAAIAQGFAAVVMLMRNQFGKTPVPFQWWRMARTVLCAGAAYLVFAALTQVAPQGRPVFAPLMILLYFCLLVLTRTVPMTAVRNIIVMLRAVPQKWSRSTMEEKLIGLSDEDRDLVALLARDRVLPGDVASMYDVDEETVHRRLVTALRRASGSKLTNDHDARIGYYVLYRGAPANREVIARDLYRDGVEPAELHALRFVYTSFWKAPRSVWRHVASADRAKLRPAPARLALPAATGWEPLVEPLVDTPLAVTRLFHVDPAGVCELVDAAAIASYELVGVAGEVP